MDVPSLKRIIGVVLGLLAAFFLANLLTTIFLRLSGISGGAGAVAGLVIFGVVFISILQGIEKLTGIGFFRFDLG
jgi:hypothetical protein